MKKNVKRRKLQRREVMTCKDYVIIQLEELQEQYDHANDLNMKLFIENQKLRNEIERLNKDIERLSNHEHKIVK